MNVVNYAKCIIILTIFNGASLLAMADEPFPFSQDCTQLLQRFAHEEFAHYLVDGSYDKALTLLKNADQSQFQEYLSLIHKRFKSISYDPQGSLFLQKLIKAFPEQGKMFVALACNMPDNDTRSRIVLMLAAAYKNMDAASKAEMHEKLALHIHPVNKDSFIVAAKTVTPTNTYDCLVIYKTAKVGYLTFRVSHEDHVGHINALYITDKFARSLGCGTHLLAFTLKSLKALGCKTAELLPYPHDSNGKYPEAELLPKLISFYERHGFYRQNDSKYLVCDLTSITKSKL